MAIEQIVLGMLKNRYKGDYDRFFKVTIPLKGKLEEIPNEIKKGYYGYDILKRVTTECGFKRIDERMLIRLDSDERYPTTCFDYPLNNLKTDYKDFLILWVKERKEWVAIAHGLADDTKNLTEKFSGPFSLDDYCRKGIIDTFNIKNNAININEVYTTNPSKLKRKSLK